MIVFNNLVKLFYFIIKLPFILKRIILIIFDSLIILSSLKINTWIFNSNLNNKLIFQIIIIGILIYVLTGQYKSLTKYIGARIMYKLFFANIIFSLAYFLLINSFYQNEKIIYQSTFLFLGTITCLSIYIRISLRDTLIYLETLLSINNRKIKKVVIYGAGKAGALLYKSLSLNGTHKIVAFVDDFPKLWKRNKKQVRRIS